MTHDRTQTGVDGVRAVLVDRARDMGLLCVRCTEDGAVVRDEQLGSKLGPPEMYRWIASSFLARRFKDLASAWANEDEPTPAQLFPGCWAIPIAETHRRRRSGYFVSIALTPDALLTEEFVASCQSAQLDAGAMRDALGRCAINSNDCISRLATTLRWAYTDRLEVSISEGALAEFSGQLAEAYEELSLLYSIGRSMNEVVHPAKFVANVCDELYATLTFGWIAAWFSDAPSPLSGAIFCSGVQKHTEAQLRELIGTCVTSCEINRTMIATADTKHCGKLAQGEEHVIIQPLMREGMPIGALLAGNKLGTDPTASSADMKLLDGAGALISVLLENSSLYDNQRQMFLGTLQALSSAIDAKDRYTRGHSERVAHLAMCLARAVGMEADEVERVRIGGLVHDVGKIGVSEVVLCKPGKLTDVEFEQIKMHPEIGHRILRDIPQLADILPAVLQHHERWDGRGYPHGVAGEEIHLYARLVGIADTFDAMSSTRTYRSALPRSTVLEEIERCAGSQFDPELAKRFVTLDFSQFDRMVARHLARDHAAGEERAA